VNLWHISEESFDPTPKKLHSQETVYTIGNGYMGTRGTFEEGYPRANPATLLYGVFDSIPVAKEELANIADWLPIALFVNGERFRLDKGRVLDYRRSLDMRHGILHRSVRWQGSNGVRIQVTTERIASLADEHVGAIRYSVKAEEGAGDLDIVMLASLNTAVGNYHLMHLGGDDAGHQDTIAWLETETRETAVHIVQTMSFKTDAEDFREEIIDSDIAPSIKLSGKIAPGAAVTAEKIVVIYTSRDEVELLSIALQHHQEVLNGPAIASTVAPAIESLERGRPYDTLLARHQEAWNEFWQGADVIIEGDEKAQLGIRYNIYQLRINASLHDARYSIAAKGLTGFGYRGHIFHDTEIFMLPFFTYVMPDVARNLLIYRCNLLQAARQKAAANGYEGAQYPWESTLDGTEATPLTYVHPETGETIIVLNATLEIHITASIAHVIWEYWNASGDDEFMRDHGAEVMLNTALFWASRARKNAEHDDYEITDVIGPDEWHEHVNNNAFTNYMAQQNIKTALETLEWLRSTAPDKARNLEQQLDLTSQRLDRWRAMVKGMRFLQDRQTGLIEQFEGFFKLKPLDQSEFKGRTKSYQALLGMEEVQQYQIVKQADVLMLLTVLREQFDLNTKRANWDYYYPITDHDYGSSLTPAFHVILACELDRANEAEELFEKGNLVDLENLRGNTPEGIHAACSGAVWQAAVFGFAGFRLSDTGYTTNPHLPDTWTRLAFTCYHKGKPIQVDLQRGGK